MLVYHNKANYTYQNKVNTSFSRRQATCAALVVIEEARLPIIQKLEPFSFASRVLEADKLEVPCTHCCQWTNFSHYVLWNLIIVYGPWTSKRLKRYPTLLPKIWLMSQLRHLKLSVASYLPDPKKAEDNMQGNHWVYIIFKHLQQSE